MSRFAPQLGALAIQSTQLSERTLQIIQPTLRLSALERGVTRRAFDHAVDEQSRQHLARRPEGPGCQLRLIQSACFQLVQHAQLQMTPLAHRLPGVITVQPTVFAVVRRTRAFVRFGCELIASVPRTQGALERIQNARNVIDELRACERCHSAHLGVAVDGNSPAREDGGALPTQVRSDLRKLGIRVEGHSRVSGTAPAKWAMPLTVRQMAPQASVNLSVRFALLGFATRSVETTRG